MNGIKYNVMNPNCSEQNVTQTMNTVYNPVMVDTAGGVPKKNVDDIPDNI